MGTFGSRVKKRRLELKLSQAALGKRAGMPQSTIGQIENGRNKSNTKILELAAALETSPEYLLHGMETDSEKRQSNVGTVGKFLVWGRFSDLPKEEYALIPFYRDTKLSAGQGTEHQSDNNKFKLAFSRSTLKRHNIAPEDAACMTVTGNSMEPVLPENTTVGIHLKDTVVSDGKIYAIKHGGLLRVKRLYLMPNNTLRINSYNQAEFQDEIVSANKVEIIGRVFWWSVLV